MFLLTWAVLFLSTSTEVSLGVCTDGRVPLTAPSAQFSSPEQGKSGVCTWQITVPKEQRIILYFKDYVIDDSYVRNPKCEKDSTRIELKDGLNYTSWKTYCQHEMPEPIATNKSSLIVSFKLSKSDDKSWFTANYTTLPFETKIDLGDASSAEIFSPMFPGRYPRNSYFRWSIVAPSGFRIKIQLTKLKIYCQDDRVMLRDGPSEQSKLLARICGERYSQPIYTSENSLTVEFISTVEESGVDNIGFKATLSKEVKLYLILLPCAIGIILLSVTVGAMVFMYRRRRLASSGASQPRMQMSLLNDDDHISATQISEADPPNEANLPVYRPTTQAIKS